MVRVVGACLCLAALSLLLPSEPSYDPWAWLVWGRELAHLALDTAGGPSWKPLPVAFTTLTAPLGEVDRSIPPALWLVVARAGTLLALAMAFRLAARLCGGGPAGALAGAVAAVAVCLTPDWFQFAAHGSEAPLAVALMLWAVERQLDRRAGQAVALGALACLLRPELAPFLGLYGAWAWLREPRLRLLLAGTLVLLPLAWIVPEWVGSGNPFDAGAQARSEPVWSLSLAERPWLRALERVHNHAGMAAELLTLIAVAGALGRGRLAGLGRGRIAGLARGRIAVLAGGRLAVLALAAFALAEAGLFVAMTQAGFSGNPRYVLPALAVTCVLAGVGAGTLVRAAGPPGSGSLARLAGAGVAVAALALLGAPVGERAVRASLRALLGERLGMLPNEARQVGVRMDVHRDLARAVDTVGGPRAVAALGPATANRALHTRLAWELGVPIELVESVTDHRVVFRSRLEPLAGRVYLRGSAHARATLARVGSVRAYRRDGITLPFGERRLEAIRSPFTPPLQGIHTVRNRGGKRAPG